MHDLIPFQFDTHSVDVRVDGQGNPWWVLQDVCAVLGLSHTTNVAERLKPLETAICNFTQDGIPHRLLLVNEPGLYRVIMRSNKPEAERFQDWVFGEVLPQIRKTGKYESRPRAPRLCELPIQEQIAGLQCALDFLADLGVLDERDKLMFGDLVRTSTQSQYIQGQGEQKLLSAPQGFFLADRVRTLGYALTRKQEASLMSQGLALAVAQEYREQHDGKKPPQCQRFVDGAVRQVFWYKEENVSWIDPLIQKWCAHVGIKELG